MTPLCSFLIPSRFRFDRLKALIESIHSASEPDHDFEIIVRLHDDDNDSINGVAELSQWPRTRYIIGKTYDGYESLHIFTAELLEAAVGEWAWHFNDDQLLEKGGIAWEPRLRSMPKNALVQPAIHRLNDSVYFNDAAGPAPCHANEPWVAEFLRSTGNPRVDTNLHAEFVRRGSPIVFLTGMGVNHQWNGLEAHAAA